MEWSDGCNKNFPQKLGVVVVKTKIRKFNGADQVIREYKRHCSRTNKLENVIRESILETM
jgi:hypothetical protein